MLHLVSQTYWFALPIILAAVLHMVAVKKDWFAAWKRPLDGGRTLGGERIFGDNKTWRGVALLTVGSMIAGAIQGALLGGWAARSGAAYLDYGAGFGERMFRYAAVGLILGLGYAVGELPNSFLKRRVRIAPGKAGRGFVGGLFLIADHSDSVVVGLGLAALVLPLGWRFYFTAVVSLSLVHLVLVLLLYAARLKREI